MSTLTQTNITLPFITSDANGPKHLEYSLTRAKFESLIADLIDKTIVCTKKALKDAKLEKSQIGKVILVGGSTRVPAVVEALKKRLLLNHLKALTQTNAWQ